MRQVENRTDYAKRCKTRRDEMRQKSREHVSEGSM